MKKLICSLLLFPALSQAEVKTITMEYSQGGQILEGSLSYDDSISEKRPGVIIVHDWLGNGEYTKMRAEQMAQLGYVAFAADIYGKGIRPTPKDAPVQAAKFKNDRPLFRARTKAAFELLANHPKVDRKKMLAMGYCFGGTAVLEMARDGLPLAGVVSFHGGLDSPTPQDGKNIKAKILIAHGAIDPFVKPAEVAAFQKELNDANVDYQFIAYSGAVHSFTNKNAGNDIKTGSAYNEKADQRSFEAMKTFFAEITR